MSNTNLNDLQAFVVVARAQSFTKAAAQLGLSRSALSHSMRALEERLGVRLLMRTTRSVSTTEAGARLLQTLAPRLDDINAELNALTAMRDKPAGLVRISTHDHAIVTVLWPRLLPLLREYPDIQIELGVDYAMTDIVAQRFDAGVRSGSLLNKDMIAVPISRELVMGVGASPAYVKAHGMPSSPQDLDQHSCINLRLPTHGGLYAWEFEKAGESLSVRVNGQVTLNNTFLMLRAALDGMGLAYVPADLLQTHFDSGELLPVLQDWWPRFAGYHLYYANRRQPSPALSLVIDALRVSA